MSVPIIVDDREKKPYQFPGINQLITKRLDVGDYTHEGFEDVYAVERKTLDDLATSLGSSRERFEAEIQRAQSLEEFVVVIEAPPEYVYDYAGTGDSPHYFSNIYPNSIIGTVEQWPTKYRTLEFIWADDRDGGMAETLYHLDKWYLRYQDSRVP